MAGVREREDKRPLLPEMAGETGDTYFLGKTASGL